MAKNLHSSASVGYNPGAQFTINNVEGTSHIHHEHILNIRETKSSKEFMSQVQKAQVILSIICQRLPIK